jgi:hypothetical protein
MYTHMLVEVDLTLRTPCIYYVIKLTHRYGLSFVQIIARVTRGDRPQLQEQCVHESNVQGAAVYTNIMKQCLAVEPTDRPTFEHIDSIVRAQ